MQENWSPAARVLVGTAGSALALYALKSRNLSGLVAGAAGATMLLRSATNLPLKRLAGMAGRRTIDIQKTINVNAPLEQVFDTLTHYENFPQFMSNVREVQVREDGGSHWTVTGPGGMSVEMGCGHDQARAESALGLADRPRGYSGACRDDPI